VYKTDCITDIGTCTLSATQQVYKTVSNSFRSRLTPYVDEIIGDHQCKFRSSRSTTDQIHNSRQRSR